MLFVTAAVEMWQRAIHSLIVAVDLSTFSQIWACSVGYYASHYSVRAFSHLFGYFALYRRRLFIELVPFGNRYRCTAISGLPPGSRREHQFYWGAIKRLSPFINDNLFTNNDDQDAGSDASHRGVASYSDHIDRFESFMGADRDWMRRSLNDLAHTSLAGEAGLELPHRDHFPQLATVLAVAYLRIYRFRDYLDALLGRPGRFWDRHRTPAWCTDLIVFPPRQSSRALIE